MSKWPTKALGEITSLVGGGTPKRANPTYWDGNIPWVTPSDLPSADEGIITIDATQDRISDLGLQSSSATLVPDDTVLFSSRATIGEVAIAASALTTNQGFANFLLSPEMLPRFLAWTLWYHRADISRLSGSTTFKEVSRTSLKRYRIPFPPLPEQERIVRLLDETDAIRKLRAKADQRTADLIPALFYKMFGDPVTNTRVWPVQPLGHLVADLQGGRNINPAGDDQLGSGYRVLKVSAVTAGRFRPEESKPLPVGYEPPAHHLVRPGDLLFSRANTTELVGATCYVEDTQPNLLLPDKLWRVVWKAGAPVDPLYMLALLQSSEIRRELSKLSSGSGGSMKNISKAKLLTLRVPVPPLQDQQKFSAYARAAAIISKRHQGGEQRLDTLLRELLRTHLNSAADQLTAHGYGLNDA